MTSAAPVPAQIAELLATGTLSIAGRIMPASNQTFLCTIGEPDSPVQAVYKPISGEKPLWDFEDGTLADREYAAFLVSEALDWSVVPLTLVREGPYGPGMVQLWCEPDPDIAPVDIVPLGVVPEDFLHVLDAQGPQDQPVTLIHEDSPALRRMALFDLVVNNTDRKGGHVLAMTSGHRYGVDHGICFHIEDKVRTVLWGWAGQPLTEDETTSLLALRTALDGELATALAPLLTAGEIRQIGVRLRRLLTLGCFPDPGDGWPPIPWPVF